MYIFGEGFDIPKVNGVCVAENMTSEIRIVQSVMRGNRLDKNNPKKVNMIILPYIENEYDTFAKVETVIEKMGNYDSNIEQKINACVIKHSGLNTINDKKINTDFNNIKELNHVKLKLRHRKILRSNDTQAKTEYNYLRSLNITLGIKSRLEYFKNTVERLDDPPSYFEKKDPTIWKSWYDFLAIDVRVFPSTKSEWKEKCNLQKITSSNYKTEWKHYNLPENPDDLYRDFKTISTELGEKRKRRH